MEKLKLLTIKKKGKNMNKNLGHYTINRKKGSYNCSITCEDLEITTRIEAINALDQVEKINATIRNFEKELEQEKIMQMHAAGGKLGQQKEIINN